MKVTHKCPYCGKSDHDSYGGFVHCPTIIKKKAVFAIQKKMNADNFFGESPTPFVGRFNYPNIDVGIMSPPEEHEKVWEFDAPRYWARQELKIPEVVNYRASLVNSTFKSNVLSPRMKDNVLDIAQQTGMASKPVELEVQLNKKPNFKLSMNAYTAPTGPNAKLKKAEITSNPKISKKVDKVVDDSDWKANDALNYLYKSGYDENFLTRMLSIGTMGVKSQRKLVPTRWSITATDDIISKNLIRSIKDNQEGDCLAFFGGYLGNNFLVLMFPDVWSFELFEMYSHQRNTDLTYTTDYEPYEGRKAYAQETAGGYYAARLPILEKLASMKRQSSVLVLRFITKEYDVPLGVWVVREAVRKSMSSKPLEFGSKELMMSYASAFAKKRFGIDITKIRKQSKLLDNINKQKKLTEFN